MNAYNALYTKIDELLAQNERVVCAIDGPCGAGKTTLGKHLQKRYGGNLFHTDDYFLPLDKRTAERLRQPGGNIDSERLCREILTPLADGGPIVCRAYDCATDTLGEALHQPPAPVNIIEGAYCLLPAWQGVYNIKVFLHIDPPAQLARLQKRSPTLLERFVREWIPLENRYFGTYNIKDACDYYFEAGVDV
jgi:uridine kinase